MGLSPKQRQSIIGSTARVNIFEGPVRSGKTLAGNLRFAEFAYHVGRTQRHNSLITGKTQETAEANVVNDLLAMFPGNTSYVKGMLTLFGHRCRVCGVNDAAAEGRIRGGTYIGWYADEVTLYPKSFFDMGRTRLSPSRAMMLGTCNPDSPYHYLKTEWIDQQNGRDCKVFSFVIDDNPSLTPEFVESLKRDYTGLFYQRFIDGKWCVAHGVIYDCWDQRNECQAMPGNAELIVVSSDYGVNNPTTFGMHCLCRGAWYRTKEYYWDSEREKRRKTDEEYAADFDNFCGKAMPDAVVVDPSATSWALLLERRGYNVVLANNDVVPGIRTLSSMMARGQYKAMTPACPDFMRERGLYVWDSKASLRGIDSPLKQNDHTMDDARYFAMYVAGPETESYPVAFDTRSRGGKYDHILREMGA